jgi:hypothetical protein
VSGFAAENHFESSPSRKDCLLEMRKRHHLASRARAAPNACVPELTAPMIANGDDQSVIDLSQQPVWAETWHLWTVLVPRRSITGRIVYGNAWRRHNGRHWKYKKFIESSADRDHWPASLKTSLTG